MKKFKISLLFLIAPLLLTSCRLFYKPYGLKVLAQLKSAEETQVLEGFATKIEFNIGYDMMYAFLEYNSTKKTIEVVSTGKQGFEPTKNDSICRLLNTYYLVTSDNIQKLFPPDWVQAHYFFRKNKRISITRYYSEETKQNRTYTYFWYEYYDGFLLLSRYLEYVNGEVNKNTFNMY